MIAMIKETNPSRNFEREIRQALTPQDPDFGINISDVGEELFHHDKEMRDYLANQHVSSQLHESTMLVDYTDLEEFAEEKINKWQARKLMIDAGLINEIEPLTVSLWASQELIRRVSSETL